MVVKIPYLSSEYLLHVWRRGPVLCFVDSQPLVWVGVDWGRDFGGVDGATRHPSDCSEAAQQTRHLLQQKQASFSFNFNQSKRKISLKEASVIYLVRSRVKTMCTKAKHSLILQNMHTNYKNHLMQSQRNHIFLPKRKLHGFRIGGSNYGKFSFTYLVSVYLPAFRFTLKSTWLLLEKKFIKQWMCKKNPSKMTRPMSLVIVLFWFLLRLF